MDCEGDQTSVGVHNLCIIQAVKCPCQHAWGPDWPFFRVSFTNIINQAPHSHRPLLSLHTKVEIYPHTSGLGMALLHIQYSSIIVGIHCQDAESVTPTLLPLKALIWEWEAHAAAVKTSAKQLKCKCMKMCSKTVGWGHLGSCSWILPGKVDGQQRMPTGLLFWWWEKLQVRKKVCGTNLHLTQAYGFDLATCEMSKSKVLKEFS